MTELSRDMFGPDAKFYLIYEDPVVCDDDEEWLITPNGKVRSSMQERRWEWEVGTTEVTWEEFVVATEAYFAKFKKVE